MSLSERVNTTIRAIDQLAHTAGASAGDRAHALRQIRVRLEQHVSVLQEQADGARGSRPVSQREGD